MEKVTKLVFSFLFFIGTINSLAQNGKLSFSEKEITKALLSTNESEKKPVLIYAYNHVPEMMNILIPKVTSKKKIRSFYIDPRRSSNILNNFIYEGVLLARYIEFLTFADGNKPICGQIDTNPEGLYRECRILKFGSEKLSLNDLVKIKSIYEHWWSSNSNIGIAEIRRKNVPFKTILKGSNFHWY
jgi:hypothetical protein